MKKLTVILMVVFFGVAMVAMPALGGAGCTKTCAKTCGTKAAKTCNMSKSSGDKTAIELKGHGSCAEIVLSIDGMTCGGCESHVAKTLEGTDGVLRVISVDHKSGKAYICVDPKKTEASKLVDAVVKKTGYKTAEIAMTDEDLKFLQKKCAALMEEEKTKN